MELERESALGVRRAIVLSGGGARGAYEAGVLRLVEFTRAADLLITDCAYDDGEYPQRVNYGHSCVSQAVDFACRARVKRLCLMHHDPDQNDAAVDAKLARAQELIAQRGAATVVCAPTERSEIEL